MLRVVTGLKVALLWTPLSLWIALLAIQSRPVEIVQADLMNSCAMTTATACLRPTSATSARTAWMAATNGTTTAWVIGKESCGVKLQIRMRSSCLYGLGTNVTLRPAFAFGVKTWNRMISIGPFVKEEIQLRVVGLSPITPTCN